MMTTGDWPEPTVPPASAPLPPPTSGAQSAGIGAAQQAPKTEITQPYGNGRRVFYGLTWLVWTVILVVAAISAFSGSDGGSAAAGLIPLVLALLAARYDYRIWTFQAKRLWFLLLF